jgi:hypothetical protein
MSSIDQQINAIVSSASAAIDAIEAQAIAAVNKLKSLQSAAATVKTEPVTAAAVLDAPVTEKKTKKAGRQVKNLPLSIVGAPIYIECTGDRWNGTIVQEEGVMKFRFNNVNYKSPTAACTAHAERITENHPEATKGASGWSWVLFADGDFKDKPISEFYDSIVPMADIKEVITKTPIVEAEPAAAGGAEEPKKKKTLSPEHLAKLKAGREAYQAKKKAEKEAVMMEEL